MGSFHGRRKPSAKKSAKPKGDTAEDLAAREAREQFITDMAAKALPPPADADSGGIHPSRLARADPFSGGQPNGAYAHHRQQERPARGQRAPDLRKPGNKRTFDDSTANIDGSPVPTKKQRTLEEIRRLKGPAAMKKEEEKRRRQMEGLKTSPSQEPISVVKTTEMTAVGSDEDETPIPSKHGKKNITAVKSNKTPEEKAQRKLEKAARKKAKKAIEAGESVEVSNSATPEPVKTETKEARKERKRAEKLAKSTEADQLQANDTSVAPSESKEERKARKKLAKLAKADQEVSVEQDAGDDESPSKDPSTTEVKQKKEKRKKEKKSKQADIPDSIAEPVAPRSVSTPQQSNNWSSAASSLGAKSSKFMKLLGGAKNGLTVPESGNSVSSSTAAQKVRDARIAEKALERQFASGMQAKQNGNKRGGLGA